MFKTSCLYIFYPAFKRAISGLFFVYFHSFQTNINSILQQFDVKKFPSSIWRWDSNPWPLERESPPITTKPVFCWASEFTKSCHFCVALNLCFNSLWKERSQIVDKASVIRLGDLLDFGQLFEAFGKNYFVQNSHILRQFFKGLKIYHFYSEIIYRQLYKHLAIFFWSHWIRLTLR